MKSFLPPKYGGSSALVSFIEQISQVPIDIGNQRIDMRSLIIMRRINARTDQALLLTAARPVARNHQNHNRCKYQPYRDLILVSQFAQPVAEA